MKNQITNATSSLNFQFESLRGDKIIDLQDYSGQVILMVNTASRCGFTPQLEGLEKLHKTYRDNGLIVIGLPCNDFLWQEPGDPETISEFCQINYGVTFTMTEKVSIYGANAHPFYRFARKKLGWLATPKWNFHKYLINREGELVDYYNFFVSPDSSRFKNRIEQLL